MHSTRALIYLLLLLLRPLFGFTTLILANDCKNVEQITSELSKDQIKLYLGQQIFSMRMLEQVHKAKPNGNILFSPYSTYHALLLAYFGANGATEEELRDALGLDWAKNKEDVIAAYRLEKRQREMFRCDWQKQKFYSADRIYFDERLKKYNSMAEFSSLNLTKNSDALQTINDWIAEVTKNKITNALNIADVNATTNLVLANAAYFTGIWKNKFNTKDTLLEPFYVSIAKANLIEMMYTKGEYLLTLNERFGAKILQIPFLEKDMTDTSDTVMPNINMIIILPTAIGQLETVLAKLKSDTIKKAIVEAKTEDVEIFLPKFEMKQNLKLKPILRNLGINSIFDSQTASFTNFTTEPNIFFDNAKHVAKILVHEDGSTVENIANDRKTIKFVCNHPFLYFIYDKKSDAVLFAGIYREPTRNH